MLSLVEDRLDLLPQLTICHMDPLSKGLSLRWDNHQSNLLSVFDHLLKTESFCDVTLACDGGGNVKCHRMVLAACSSYFEKLFMENNSQHPIVFLVDVKFEHVRSILDYMYKGEVSVAQEELADLLHIAELLQVKGMVEEEQEKVTILKESSQCSSSPGSGTIVSNSSGENIPAPRESHLFPPHTFRSFLTPPIQGSTPPFPMWPLPGLFPGHRVGMMRDSVSQAGPHSLFHPRDEMKDLSPGPDRIRSNIASSSSPGKDLQLPPLIPRIKPAYEPLPGGGSYPGHMLQPGFEMNSLPTRRLEWKRYKQYTKSDIMAAIDEVKKGMSALQASRKFGVPSRTLYDKVKKLGIARKLHHSNGKMARSMKWKSDGKYMPGNTTAYSAAFPGMNMMPPLSRLPEGISLENPYKDLMERMKEAEDTRNITCSEEGVDPTTRDPTPPFSIIPPAPFVGESGVRIGRDSIFHPPTTHAQESEVSSQKREKYQSPFFYHTSTA